MNKLAIALTIAFIAILPAGAQNTSSPQFMMGSLDGYQRAQQDASMSADGGYGGGTLGEAAFVGTYHLVKRTCKGIKHLVCKLCSHKEPAPITPPTPVAQDKAGSCKPAYFGDSQPMKPAASPAAQDKAEVTSAQLQAAFDIKMDPNSTEVDKATAQVILDRQAAQTAATEKAKHDAKHDADLKIVREAAVQQQ
jgi:hypothetical protein